MVEYGRDGNPRSYSADFRMRPPPAEELVRILDAPSEYSEGRADRVILACDGRATVTGEATHRPVEFAHVRRHSQQDLLRWWLAYGPATLITALHKSTEMPVDPHERGEAWDGYVNDLRDQYRNYTGREYWPGDTFMAPDDPELNATDEGEATYYPHLVEELASLSDTSLSFDTRTKWRIQCPECGKRVDARRDRAAEVLERIWNETRPNPWTVAVEIPEDDETLEPGRCVQVPLVLLGVMLGAFR